MSRACHAEPTPLIRSARAHQVRIRLRDDRDTRSGHRADDRLLPQPSASLAGSSVKAFQVYNVGETEADIREGQDFPKLWAKWHYDWSTPGAVTLTVGHIGVTTMRFIGPRFLSSYYKKVYDGL
jgi:hypothetical protein